MWVAPFSAIFPRGKKMGGPISGSNSGMGL
jgi:hypothetical protein